MENSIDQGRATLAAKLAAVMGGVGRVPKRGHNSYHGYDYVKEGDLMAAVQELMAEQRVVMLPSIRQIDIRPAGEKGDVVSTVIMDFRFVCGDTGAELAFSMAGSGADKVDKGIFKAQTGAMKYAIMKAFLVATGDDPERDEAPSSQRGNSEGREGGRSAARPKPAPPQNPAQRAADAPPGRPQVVPDPTDGNQAPRPAASAPTAAGLARLRRIIAAGCPVPKSPSTCVTQAQAKALYDIGMVQCGGDVGTFRSVLGDETKRGAFAGVDHPKQVPAEQFEYLMAFFTPQEA